MKDNIKMQEDFTEYVNREVLSSMDWAKLKESYTACDYGYMKELLKQMTDKFCKIYGTNELNEDYEFVLVPAVIHVCESGNLYAGIVQLDLTSSGEHYGTDFFTHYGVYNIDDEELTEKEIEYVRSFHPYDYFPTVQYPNDIHVDWSKCPAEVCDIINYCHTPMQEQNGGMELK